MTPPRSQRRVAAGWRLAPLRPISPPKTTLGALVHVDELPVVAAPSGDIEDPDAVAEEHWCDEDLQFVDEVVLQCLAGDVGADDLHVLVAGDLLGATDRLDDVAIQAQ